MRNPSSYLKHFQLHRLPFRQQPDPEIFFAEAGRGEILQGLCADVAAGTSLVRLTGGEGTGKTLLFLLLARKLGIKKFVIVCLDHPVGSFEELLQIICRSLRVAQNMEPDEEKTACSGAGHLPELLGLLRERRGRGQRVVLIIDEAEQLFMATLERLVRLLADTGQEKLLQIVMFGRPELDRNLQQLSSYCNHADIHAAYTLLPLDLHETGEYLFFRLGEAGGDPEKVRNIFSEGAIAALHQAAKGKLSLTNLLAEQGMARAFESGMFQVEADQVSSPQERKRGYSSNLAPFWEMLQKYRIPALTGSLLVLSLLLLFFLPEKEEAVFPRQDGGQATEVEPNPPSVATEEKEVAAEKVAEKNVPVEQPPPGNKEDVTLSAAPPEVAADRTGDRVAVSAYAGEGAGQPELPAENPAGKSAAPPAPEPVALPFPQPESGAAEKEPGQPSEAEGGVPEIPSPVGKKIIVLQTEGRKRKVAGTTKETLQSPDKETNDPEQLFAERVRESSEWYSKSGFTIQLMALASETAEENFKGLLVQERYAGVRDKVYVLRKAFPPTLFVFYGYYETMEKARRDRDRLPDFLRKNQPYPLSIEQASKKARD